MRLEGEQLGHYQLTRFIQSGGMGEVYLAEDLTLSRQVAIKVMKTEPVLYPDAQASKDAARLFQREMQAISMLDHAHILTLHEAGEQHIGQENITYMVMPYCPEGSLADWIRRYHSEQPLSPAEVAHILQQAADALQYAHDQQPQILHLDVKPANFLIRRQQDPSQLPNLLLADFGVAKIATASKPSATPRGTFDYMAPEQIAGTPVAASDQYALGIMIYELLTGRTPYQGALPHVIPYMRTTVDPEPPSTVNPSLPSALDGIVLQALAKVPQDRFASVKEFASAFAGALKPSTKQPHKMQQPHLQKELLSPQAYQFATTYQLGTPLEEFRVGYQIIDILIGIVCLIIAGSVGLVAKRVLGASGEGLGIIAGGLLVLLVLLSLIKLLTLNGILRSAALGLAGGLFGSAISLQVEELLKSFSVLQVGGVELGTLAGLIIAIASVASGVAFALRGGGLAGYGAETGAISGIGVLASTGAGALYNYTIALLIFICLAIWFILYPKFHRSWGVYLYSGGFVYTHGKKFDVLSWSQITKVEEGYDSAYIITYGDSRKVVLKPIFLSIERLGSHIIHEVEQLKKS